MLNVIRQNAQSWGVKIAFGIIILVFVFWGVNSMDQAPVGVVATVNGQNISRGEFDNLVGRQEQQMRAMMPGISQEDIKSLGLRSEVLRSMVSRLLVEQEAKRLGVTVTPVELLRVVSEFPDFKKDGKFDKRLYEERLEKNGFNVAEYEAATMRDLLMEKMRSLVTSSVSVTEDEARRRFGFQAEQRVISYVLFPTADYTKGITVSDESVKQYYDENQTRFAEPPMTALSYIEVTPDNFAPFMTVSDAEVNEAYARGPQRFNLHQIVVPVPEGDDAKAAAAKASAEALVKDIRSGKDFAQIAKEKSDDSSASSGGAMGWVSVRNLPAEVAEVLAKLRPGAVSDPIRIGSVYLILKHDGTEPDWTRPEAEIKAALKQAIATEKAALDFRDTQSQAEDMLVIGKPLTEIAAAMHAEVQSTALAPRETLAALLGARKAVDTALFSVEKGKLVNTMMETENGFVIAAVKDQQEARTKPLADVSDSIKDTLIRREGEKKAEEAARAALTSLATPESAAAYKNRMVTSKPFNRTGNIEELGGGAKALSDAAFGSPLNVWLAQPFATEKGAVVAMPVEEVSLTDEAWEKGKNGIMAELLRVKQEGAWAAFMETLGQKAKISVPDTSILQ